MLRRLALFTVPLAFAASANAAITGLTNADFETGVGDQNVPDWFDISSGNGDLVQSDTANTAIPDDVDGTGWLNIVDNTTFTGDRGVYQSFGTHDLGIVSYDVSYIKGQRSDALFNELILELWYGTATGADSTDINTLGLTLADSVTIDDTGLSGESTFAEEKSLDATGVPTGETLWLAFRTTDDNTSSSAAEQGLIDDVTISGVIPEPASLALVALGGLAMLGRRRSA